MSGAAARLRPIEPLFLDEHLLIIDKPPHVLVTTDGVTNTDARTLIRSGELCGSSREALTPMNRIEEDASGVVVYCRTDAARAQLDRAVEHGTARVVYTALVVGYVAGDGRIDGLLHYDKKRSRFVVDRARGRAATTEYRIAERLAGHTLLECVPRPDLTEQVRAHLASIGYPLAVDPTYGGGREIVLSHFKSGYSPSRRREERPLISRLSLHLGCVELTHPATGQTLCFEAPPPRDFRAAVTQLGRLA